MQVRETEFPREAITWIERGDPFDVAILDMHMPEVDGLTVARAIRSRNGDRTAILVMTSLGKLDDLGEHDDFAFLTKPVKPSQLFDALVELLAPADGTVAVGLHASPAGAQANERIFDPETAARHPLRILLAEDNALNRQMALQILGRLGYGADVATNGVEAISALRAAEYDVVLMDVQMPEMDGLEAARRICADWPRAQRPRIVAMTANTMSGDREECLAAGMDDYLPKPIRVPDLVAALERVRARGIPVAAAVPTAAAPTPTAASAPAGDGRSRVLEALRPVVGEDSTVIVRFLDLFVASGATLLDQLEDHRVTGDRDAFTRCAHTLKANAASLGAPELAARCAELEDAGRRGSLDGVEPLVADARLHLALLVAEIESLREELT